MPDEILYDSPDFPLFKQDKIALQTAKNKSRRIDYFGILGISVGTTLTFSKDITIRNELPSHKKIIDYIGVDTLLSELENYTSNTTTYHLLTLP